MALSEPYKQVDIQSNKTSSNQLKNFRITRDNCDVKLLSDTLKSTCHPFAANTPSDLVNISTGKAASSETTSYLLSKLQRGNEARHKFERECLTDSTRFMKTLSRIDIKNIKRKTMESRKPNVTEGVRDIFARLLTLAARESRAIDLHHIPCYPITDVPLSLAHADGTPLKTKRHH